MGRFLVGKTFPIAPITTRTTSLTNDQLPFPMLSPPPLPPPLAPFPPLRPVAPSPRARNISSRRKIHAPGHGAPIGNAVAAEHESFPATTTTTTITITTSTTTTATVIAALASECSLQLLREGSGYGGGIGHHVPPPSHPRVVNNHLHHHHRRPYRRRCHRYTRGGSSRRRAEKPGCVRRHQALRVR